MTAAPQCTRCGYSLTGLIDARTPTAKCPECGEAWRWDGDRAALPAWFPVADLACGLLAWMMPLTALAMMISVAVRVWIVLAVLPPRPISIQPSVSALAFVPGLGVLAGLLLLTLGLPRLDRWAKYASWVICGVSAAALCALFTDRITVGSGGRVGPRLLTPLGEITLPRISIWLLAFAAAPAAGVLLSHLGNLAATCSAPRPALLCRRSAIPVAIIGVACAGFPLALAAVSAASATPNTLSGIGRGFPAPPASPVSFEVRQWMLTITVAGATLIGMGLWFMVLWSRATLRAHGARPNAGRWAAGAGATESASAARPERPPNDLAP